MLTGQFRISCERLSKGWPARYPYDIEGTAILTGTGAREKTVALGRFDLFLCFRTRTPFFQAPPLRCINYSY